MTQTPDQPPENEQDNVVEEKPQSYATNGVGSVQEEGVGVFSGWGFDMNTMTNNMSSISNILSSTGDSVGGLFAKNESITGLFGSPLPINSADKSNENVDNVVTDANLTTVSADSGSASFNGQAKIVSDATTDGSEDHSIQPASSQVGQDENLGATAAHLASAATVELEQASRAAQETIGMAAQKIGRGWGTLNNFLDDMLAPDGTKTWSSNVDGSNSRMVSDDGGNTGSGGMDAGAGASGSMAEIQAILGDSTNNDVNDIFRQLFPHLESSEDEEVVDHYQCTMVQKYRCYLNNATPEKAFALQGRLFVTMSNIAMYITNDGSVFGGSSFGVNIPFQEVVKIQKGAKAMLRVVTKSQTSFIFAGFESDTHYTGALSLLEQLCAAASNAPVVAANPTSVPNDDADAAGTSAGSPAPSEVMPRGDLETATATAAPSAEVTTKPAPAD